MTTEFKPSAFVGSKNLLVFKNGEQVASIRPLNGGFSLRLRGAQDGEWFRTLEAAKAAA